MHNLVFLGPPGSGKGTQAARLSAEVGISHLSTGEILRNSVAKKTELGLKAKAYMDKGELVPDEVLVGMIERRIGRGELDKGFVLDGFPRTVSQAKSFKDMLNKNDMKVKAAVLFDVSDEEVVKRLSGRWFCAACQRTYNCPMHAPKVEGVCDADGEQLQRRKDDEVDVVRKRISVYREQTAPIVDYYRNESILTVIPGERSPDAVFDDLLEVVQ